MLDLKVEVAKENVDSERGTHLTADPRPASKSRCSLESQEAGPRINIQGARRRHNHNAASGGGGRRRRGSNSTRKAAGSERTSGDVGKAVKTLAAKGPASIACEAGSSTATAPVSLDRAKQQQNPKKPFSGYPLSAG